MFSIPAQFGAKSSRFITLVMSEFPLHLRSRLKRFEISEASTPNYLFAMWLKEWYEEAASRDSKLQFAYRKVSVHTYSRILLTLFFLYH